MDGKSEKITVEKQALIQAVLELERQEEIKASILLECVSQLKAATARVEQTLMEDRSAQAKTVLLNLFGSDSDWRLILTEDQIEAWKAEFATHFKAV